VAKSKEVEVLENRVQWLEMGGNIVPVTKSASEQLNMNFMAFYENRLPFAVRIKDVEQTPPMGRLVFLKDAKSAPLKSDVRSPPVCTLDIQLPPFNREAIEYDELKKKNTIERGLQFAFLNESAGSLASAAARSTNLIYNNQHQPDNHVEFNLRLLANDLNNMDGTFDWVVLAQKLDMTTQEIDYIRQSSSGSPNLLSSSPANQTYDMLTYWQNKIIKDEQLNDASSVESNAITYGELLLKALKYLNVDEELINRNMFTSSTSFSNANQLESIYSVEKSLAKNLNLNG
jgi:hypothetical protein